MSEHPEPTSPFDFAELTARTSGHMPNYCRDAWLSGRELGRWLLADGIARPNGAAGRLELTGAGTALVGLVANTWCY